MNQSKELDLEIPNNPFDNITKNDLIQSDDVDELKEIDMKLKDYTKLTTVWYETGAKWYAGYVR